MKELFSAIAVVLTLALPAFSAASPSRPGPYGSFFLGASIPLDTDATGVDFLSSPAVSFDDRVALDPGIDVGGTAGYDFGSIRLEGELSYKYSAIASVTEKAGGLRFRNVDGNLGALAVMANAFFDLHNGTPVTPYWGGGVGFASLHLTDTFGTDPTTGLTGPLYLGDTDTVFAYQAGLGLEIALDRQLSLDLGYRYLGTSRARFGANEDITTDLKFESHNATVGIRARF